MTQGKKKYPKNKTIKTLFEEQVNKTPNSIAIIFAETILTFQQLNDYANQFAHYLLSISEIKPDALIALCLERNEYMIIGILGVLKTGAAYVPIDPHFPDERINYFIEDTNVSLIVTNHKHWQRLNNICNNNSNKVTIIPIDAPIVQEKLISFNTTNPVITTQSYHLAYVIYTSGTTGKPKGVMLEHKGVINLIYYLKDKYNFAEENEVIVLFTNYIFDTSIEQIVLALLNGFTLLLLPKDIWLHFSEFYAYLNKHKATQFISTPSFLTQYNFRLVPSIKRLITAGELSSETLIKTFQQHADYQVIIEYGPTETTIACIINTNTHQNYSIGKPIYNTTSYILNTELLPVAIGEIGELHIGGVGLARGYLNQPELTAQKFISNPFQTKQDKRNNQNSRLYKTGDLARYLADGNIEYIGRKDFQIKLRGFRIELSEIEHTLSNHPDIKQCVVLVKENRAQKDIKYLVAYYIPQTEVNLETKNLINYLKCKLPEYMIPNFFIALKKFPLCLNGKLDRTSLPELNLTEPSNYIAPQTDIEKKLVTIWAQALNLAENNIGIADDFFKLGGNSLNVIRLVFLLQNYFSINISDIYLQKTIKNIINNVIIPEQYNTDFQNKKKSITISTYNKDFTTVKNKYENSNNKYYNMTLKKNENKKIILLTGATGYLGIHILNELLENSLHNIILIIREETKKDALIKMNNKYNYYFSKNINNYIYTNRIQIYNGYLDLDFFYLSQTCYNEIARSVDIIIHAAAYVKYFGHTHLFYAANVTATINIIKFAKHFKNKEIHYISTNSVCQNGYYINNNSNIYTEYDIPLKITNQNNYIKTKLEAEILCLAARKENIITNIYRIGNLLINSDNHLPQENINDNASINILKSTLKLKLITESQDEIEISPVNFTAKFLVNIIDINNLKNESFHLFNEKKFYISELLKSLDINIRKCNDENFLQFLNEKYENEISKDEIGKFFLSFGCLEKNENSNQIKPLIFQDKTNIILKKLNFFWPEVSALHLIKLLSFIS